jgi:hypothetical protein
MVQPPTRREIVLVLVLAISLVLFTKSTYTPPTPPKRQTSSHHESSARTETNYTGIDSLSLPAWAPPARLTWNKGSVPQSTLVGHVPGIYPNKVAWSVLINDMCSLRVDHPRSSLPLERHAVHRERRTCIIARPKLDDIGGSLD